MVYQKFFINILFRVIILSLTCFVFVFLIQIIEKEYVFSLIGIIGLIILQIVLLVYYVNKTNRDLARFYSAVEMDDSTLVFSEKTASITYKELYHQLHYINKLIGTARSENVQKNIYLQNVVDHVGVGLISFRENGEVELLNKAVKDLLSIYDLGNIRDLNRIHKDLPEIIKNLQPGNSRLLKVIINNEVLQLSLKINVFVASGKTVKLVSLQNIINELERNELNSYQKIIRVLTHEIMNSISPVTSLTKTITGYFRDKTQKTLIQPENIDKKVITKTVDGLETIEETGKGLLGFVGNYRSLTSLPTPKFEKFPVEKLFHRIQVLLKNREDAVNIKIEIDVQPGDLELTADEKQLEQILINLTNNSVQAIGKKTDGLITLRSFKKDNERIIIEVTDNGVGIPESVIDDIFIPFFTTREEGSGIGLSLSRQIMRLHNGNISVSSIPEKETVFTLTF